MHATILPLIAAFLSFTPPTLALPTTQPTNPPATLLPRTDFCYNAPNTEAGTATYLHITYAYAIQTPYIETLLTDASAFVSLRISSAGDGPVPAGVYLLRNYGLELRFTNANNHQLTWGVTGAAVEALREYMQGYILGEGRGVLGAVAFEVFDGGNWVGVGALHMG